MLELKAKIRRNEERVASEMAPPISLEDQVRQSLQPQSQTSPCRGLDPKDSGSAHNSVVAHAEDAG